MSELRQFQPHHENMSGVQLLYAGQGFNKKSALPAKQMDRY
jgi:hypothetical protein